MSLREQRVEPQRLGRQRLGTREMRRIDVEESVKNSFHHGQASQRGREVRVDGKSLLVMGRCSLVLRSAATEL